MCKLDIFNLFISSKKFRDQIFISREEYNISTNDNTNDMVKLIGFNLIGK